VKISAIRLFWKQCSQLSDCHQNYTVKQESIMLPNAPASINATATIK
jgi:hypothetical protein